MSRMPERSTYSSHRHRVHDHEPDHAAPSAEECIGLVWELTMNAWAFTGHGDAQPRLRKDVFRSGRLRTRPSTHETK
jgi:hypothetical protein